MSEIVQNQEKEGKQISRHHVERQLGVFVQQLQTGFQSEEARLEAYATFISTTADFFSQKGIYEENSSQSHEALSLVDKFFYNHTTNIPIEIDFFEKATEHVKKDILDPKEATPLSTYWKDEIKLFGSIARQEAITSHRALQDERKARHDLEALGLQKDTRLPEEGDPIGKVETEVSEAIIKKAVLDALEMDPAGKAEITKIRAYQEALKSVIGGTVTAQEIESKLKNYRNYLGDEEGNSLYNDLFVRADRGHEKYVKNKIQKILGIEDSVQPEENSDFLWDNAVNAGIIPGGLFQSFEQLQTLAQLSNVAKELADQPKSEKAEAFLPFIEQGISASLLYEIAQGRFELPDDYVVQQVDAFLDFYGAYAATTTSARHHRFGKTRRVAAALLAATILGVPLSTATTTVLEGMEHRSAQKTVEKIEEDIQYSYEESSDVNNYYKPKPSTSESQTAAEPQQVGESSLLRPENTPPAEFANNLGEVLWTLRGGYDKDLMGLYRTGTAAEFDPTQLGWKISKSALPEQDIVQSDYQLIEINGDKFIGNSQILELPVKSDYAIARNDFWADTNAEYSLKQATDGTYFVQFGPEAVGKTIHVEYRIGPSDYQTIPEPSQTELAAMSEVFITSDELPNGDLKNLLQALQEKSEYSPAMKAKILEIFIKKHFLYSLDPSVSKDYLSQGNVTEYLARIAEVQKGDCDVINTFYAMLLRSQGIPTRLAYGNAHTGLTSGDSTKLTAAEMHGWVEAYLGDGWITLDATPETFDEYTRDKLQDKLQQSGQQQEGQEQQPGQQENSQQNQNQNQESNEKQKNKADKEAADALDKILNKDKENKDDNAQEEGDPNLIPPILLALLTASMIGSGIGHFTRKGNDEIAKNLDIEANKRFWKYIDPQGVPQEVMNKLWSMRDKYHPTDDFFRDFSGIKKAKAVLGIFDALSAWKERRDLRKISHNNPPQTELTGTTDPDAVGLRTAMGEQKENAEARIQESEKRTVKRDIDNQLTRTIWEISKHADDNESFNLWVKHELDNLKEPQTEAEAEAWERTTSAITERLYTQLQSTRKLRKFGRRYIPGRKITPSKKTIAREEFDAKVHELFTLKLALWCVNYEDK